MQQPIKIRRWEFVDFVIEAVETPHPQVVVSILLRCNYPEVATSSRGVVACTYADWRKIEPINETVPASLMAEVRAAFETIKDQIPNEVFKS